MEHLNNIRCSNPNTHRDMSCKSTKEEAVVKATEMELGVVTCKARESIPCSREQWEGHKGKNSSGEGQYGNLAVAARGVHGNQALLGSSPVDDPKDV